MFFFVVVTPPHQNDKAPGKAGRHRSKGVNTHGPERQECDHRKALAWIKKIHKSAQIQMQISGPPPSTKHKRGMQRRRNRGPRCAKERPAGLPQAGRPSTCTRRSQATHTDTRRRSGVYRRRRWLDGHTPRATGPT